MGKMNVIIFYFFFRDTHTHTHTHIFIASSITLSAGLKIFDRELRPDHHTPPPIHPHQKKILGFPGY